MKKYFTKAAHNFVCSMAIYSRIKKIVTLVFCLTLIIALPVIAQTANDIIYLTNGSIIKGTITEEVMGESVRLETKDGNIFVLKMEEVEKITKDPAAIGQTSSEIVYLKNGSIIKGTVTEQVVGENIKIQTSDGNIIVYKMEDVDKITKVPAEVATQQTEINQVETMNQEPGSVDLNSTTQSDEEGVKFSIYLGSSSFSMNYKDDQFADSSYTSDSRSGFVIGGYFDFPIWDFLLFQAGIEYTQKGGEVNRNLTEVTYDFSYLTLPVILKACISNESKFTPFAFFGLSNGIMISATETTSIGSRDVKSDWNSWELAALLGAGMDYQVSEMIAISGQFRYSIGLSNILEYYYLFAIFKPFITTSGYNLMAGVKFNL